jgi:hypothetical protein
VTANINPYFWKIPVKYAILEGCPRETRNSEAIHTSLV